MFIVTAIRRLLLVSFFEMLKACLVVVQSPSHVQLFATPWTAAHQASLFNSNSRSLLKLMSIESVMPSSRLILYHPLPLLPSVFPSIRGFSSVSALHIRRPKSWSCPLGVLATVAEQVLDMRLLPHAGPHICRRHSAGNFHSLLRVGAPRRGQPLSSYPPPLRWGSFSHCYGYYLH